MEEVKSLQINGEEAGDEFYEKIEAPKFVDFTVPDRHHPDDRYWFCLRVGCDQKHEEVLDSEAIYKDFVLRVMAARSPNIKLRKALDRKPPSPSLKYPLTAPAKPSKSRIARLALISSISKKVEAKDKSRPLLKVSGTPNAKSKQSCVAAKAFTSPRNNRKQIANPDTFRSVRNPRPTDIMVPKNRIVAKALVFHSPKKVVRTKISVDLKTPVKKLCAAMKKLDVADGKKRTLGYNKTLPLDTSRKQVRGREVKSRVFNSLRSNIRKDQEAKPLKCMKRKDREPNLKQRCNPVLHEPGENDLSDMEIDDRSRSDSLEGRFVPGTSKMGDSNDHEECLDVVKTSEPSLSEHPLEDFSQTSRGDTTSLTSCEERDSGDVVKTSEPSLSEHPLEVLLQTSRGDTTSLTSCEERDSGDSDPNACHHEGKIKASPGKRNSPANVDSDDKEYVLASDNTDNDGEDKENASASDYNRGLNDCLEGTISNHDTSKNTKKASQVTKKTLKKNSTSAATSALEAKYKKPKPTNPKPFRLRTDERRILKEANLEKKLLTPHKEMKSVKVPGAKPLRKHQNMIQKNENNNGQSEHKNDAHEDCEKRMEKRTHVDQHGKSGTTCSRNLKTSFALDSQKENGRIREERTKSPMVMQKNLLRPQRVASCRKVRVSSKTPEQLSMIKETSSTVLGPQEAAKPCESSSARQASKATPFRSLSRGRRPTTIPKEPNFHSIHVPKSCTRKMTVVI